MNSNLTVYVCEEYGYRYWRWKPNMSLDNLKKFWTELQIVPFYNPSVLPGKWEQIKHNPHYGAWTDAPWIHAHVHSTDDSYLYIPDDGYVYHAGYNGPRQ
jgi:hypothetical protein